jgi:hypothetical protein
LTGPEPHAGDRFVVLVGRDAHTLHIYGDEPAFGTNGLAVLFGAEPGRSRTSDCATIAANNPKESRLMLVLAGAGRHASSWSVQSNGCARQNDQPATHDIHLRDGLAFVMVTKKLSDNLTVNIDPSANISLPRTPVADSRSFVGRLPGQRVATSVKLDATPVPEPTLNTAVNPRASTASGSSGLHVARVVGPTVSVRGGGGGRFVESNALGWASRYDDSGGQLFDFMFAVGFTSPEHRRVFPQRFGGFQLSDVLHIALPDGTLVYGQAIRASSGPARMQVAAAGSPDDIRGYIDAPIDPKNRPVQFSAVMHGRDGNRWLFVAGEPGVASIDYRAKGSAHWQSMDVYESTAYLRLPRHDKGDGTIRLRTTNGTTVYQGKVGALRAL